MIDSYDTLEKRKAVERAIAALSDYVIPPSKLKYDQGPPLGRGGFGEVVKATLLERQFFRTKRTTVAVKTLIPKVQDTVRVALEFTREVTLWRKLDHPNVLKLLGFNLNPKTFREAYIVAPYLQNGSIRGYLSRIDAPIEQRFGWVNGVTEGLLYLHTLLPPIIHGDLKADNVLLNESLQPLLCDFGLSIVGEESWHSGLTTSGGFKGSIRWCSPEVFLGERRTLPSDIWAWALVILEIMTKNIPFQDCETDFALMKRLTDGKGPAKKEYPPFPLDVTLWPFLNKCFDNDPAGRPDASKCFWEMKALTNVQNSSGYLGKRRMKEVEGSPYECTGQIVILYELEVQAPRMKEMAFSPSGSLLGLIADGEENDLVEMWDVVNNVQLWVHDAGQVRRDGRSWLAFNAEESVVIYRGVDNFQIIPINDPILFSTLSTPHSYTGHNYKGLTFRGPDLLIWTARSVERLFDVATATQFKPNTIFDTQISWNSADEYNNVEINYVTPSPDAHRLLVVLYTPWDLRPREWVCVWPVEDWASQRVIKKGAHFEINGFLEDLYYNWLSDNLMLVGNAERTTVYDLTSDATWTFKLGQLRLTPSSPWLAFFGAVGRFCWAQDVIAAVERTPEGGELEVQPRVTTKGTGRTKIANHTLLSYHMTGDVLIRIARLAPPSDEDRMQRPPLVAR